jgi:hypothetical protein
MSDEFDRAENGVLFKEIKLLLHSSFRSFSVKHCPRACNKVANALVLFGSKLVHQPIATWQGDVHSFARMFVASNYFVLPV